MSRQRLGWRGVSSAATGDGGDAISTMTPPGGRLGARCRPRRRCYDVVVGVPAMPFWHRCNAVFLQIGGVLHATPMRSVVFGAAVGVPATPFRRRLHFGL